VNRDHKHDDATTNDQNFRAAWTKAVLSPSGRPELYEYDGSVEYRISRVNRLHPSARAMRSLNLRLRIAFICGLAGRRRRGHGAFRRPQSRAQRRQSVIAFSRDRTAFSRVAPQTGAPFVKPGRRNLDTSRAPSSIWGVLRALILQKKIGTIGGNVSENAGGPKLWPLE